jgi:hypothetical protein
LVLEIADGEFMVLRRRGDCVEPVYRLATCGCQNVGSSCKANAAALLAASARGMEARLGPGRAAGLPERRCCHRNSPLFAKFPRLKTSMRRANRG